MLGDLEVTAQNDKALAILLDENGRLVSTRRYCQRGNEAALHLLHRHRWRDSNAKRTLCPAGAAKDPNLLTCKRRAQSPIEATAIELGTFCEETDIDLHDAYNAEVTRPSFRRQALNADCVCPIPDDQRKCHAFAFLARVDGKSPVEYINRERRIIDAYVRSMSPLTGTRSIWANCRPKVKVFAERSTPCIDFGCSVKRIVDGGRIHLSAIEKAWMS